MKKLWNAVWTPVTIALALLGASAVPEQIGAWQKILAPLPAWMSAPLTEYGPALALVAYLVCALWAASVCMSWLIAMATKFPSAFIAFRLKVRRWLGMAKWIDINEAEEIVRGSDFWAVRTGSADMSEFNHAIRAMMTLAATRKQKIIERRYVQKILASFDEAVVGGVEGDKYDLQLLQRWLDALIDKEVESQLGAIPRVSI